MTIDNSETLERIRILTGLHEAPGFEDEVRSYMKSEMEPYVDRFIQNKMGGFYGIKRSNKENASQAMIAAHMDEIDSMITHINDNGVTRFMNLGGVASDTWQEQRLKIRNRYGKEIAGVVANIPKHFRTGSESMSQIKDLMLDIDASSSEEVRSRGVEVGDIIVPHAIVTQLSKNRYSAKAWDNRYDCVLAIEILELLKNVQLDADLYIDANVQEEVGLKGAKAIAK